MIVTRLQTPPTCQARFLLDGKALKEKGATTLRFKPEAVEVLSVRKGRGMRP